MSETKPDDFSLKSNSDGFNSRLNSVFNNLQSLEENHESWRKSQDVSESKRLWKDEPEDVPSEGRSFKLPVVPRIDNKWRSQHSRNTSKQHVPGFQQNPSQWVKYSLADVSDYDLSDKSNTKTALSFIHMRKRQRLQENLDSNDESVSKKPVFRKPVKQSHEDSLSNNDLVANKPGVIIMPECIIGSSKPRNITKMNISKTAGSEKNICLDHLNEDGSSDSNDEDSRNIEEDMCVPRKKFKNFKPRSFKPTEDEIEDADD